MLLCPTAENDMLADSLARLQIGNNHQLAKGGLASVCIRMSYALLESRLQLNASIDLLSLALCSADRGVSDRAKHNCIFGIRCPDSMLFRQMASAAASDPAGVHCSPRLSMWCGGFCWLLYAAYIAFQPPGMIIPYKTNISIMWRMLRQMLDMPWVNCSQVINVWQMNLHTYIHIWIWNRYS